MAFNNFRVNVAIRLILIFLLVFLALWGYLNAGWQLTPIISALVLILLFVDLMRYIESTNREFASFLEFVSHRDFSIALPAEGRGRVFRELEYAYKALVNTYRNLNMEKAVKHQYLESIVDHVGVALVCVDENERVQLMNREAKAMLKAPYLYSIDSFQKIDQRLPAHLKELSNGSRALIEVKIGDESLQVALYATEFQMLGARYKLISLQNIRDELEQREVDFSQKLIRVLTHEIMNSVTPIISLTEVIEDKIIDEVTGEVATQELSAEDQEDLLRCLASIQSRGSGLLRFMQAYSTLTNLPRPNFSEVDVAALFDRVQSMMTAMLDSANVELVQQVPLNGLVIKADPQQIEQVLINLIKNAVDALAGNPAGRILMRAEVDEQNRVLLKVIDNGQGIDKSQLENIFVPFFTTKRHGSGVGLSISRQIMFLNKGMLSVESFPGLGTEFTLKFKS